MLQYQIALLNVDFDNTYRDAIHFQNRDEQEQYFDVENLFVSAPLVNFNVGNFYRTRITFVGKNENLIDKMNYNYCIIKDNDANKYYYYFITDSKFNNDRQIECGIELDVLNTYLLDLNFDDCMIERAHINRFKTAPYNKDYVVFDWGKDSKLYEREPIQASKVLVNRKAPTYLYDTKSSLNVGMNQWLHSSGTAWCYIFLAIKDGGYTGLYDGVNTKSYDLPFYYIFDDTTDIANQFVYQPYIVLCYPIMNKGSLNIRRNKDSGLSDILPITADAVQKFIDDNGGNANVLTMKISNLAPFTPSDYSNDFDVSDDGKKAYMDIKQGQFNDSYHNLNLLSLNSDKTQGIMIVRAQYLFNELNGVAINGKFTFNKDDIKKNRSIEYNPKLYNADYYNARITNGVNAFDYDIAKLGLNENVLNVKYTEIISPDITKQYVRIAPYENSVYSKDTTNNFSGMVSSLDFSMPYSKNNLDVYLANNKNFFMQTISNTGVATGGMVGGAVAGIVAGLNPVGIAVGATVATVGIIGNIISKGMQYDNLKSSPEQLANSNSNGAFNLAVTGTNTYVEYYDTIDNEKRMLDDYTHLYGYTYNQVDNIKNVINIRKNFNFIKADVNIIRCAYPISNEIKSKIKQIFNNGVTFWNKTPNMFNHNVPNYERWLDNE